VQVLFTWEFIITIIDVPINDLADSPTLPLLHINNHLFLYLKSYIPIWMIL